MHQHHNHLNHRQDNLHCSLTIFHRGNHLCFPHVNRTLNQQTGPLFSLHDNHFAGLQISRPDILLHSHLDSQQCLPQGNRRNSLFAIHLVVRQSSHLPSLPESRPNTHQVNRPSYLRFNRQSNQLSFLVVSLQGNLSSYLLVSHYYTQPHNQAVLHLRSQLMNHQTNLLLFLVRYHLVLPHNRLHYLLLYPASSRHSSQCKVQP